MREVTVVFSDVLAALAGVSVDTMTKQEAETWLLNRIPPGEMVTAWVGDLDDEACPLQ